MKELDSALDTSTRKGVMTWTPFHSPSENISYRLTVLIKGLTVLSHIDTNPLNFLIHFIKSNSIILTTGNNEILGKENSIIIHKPKFRLILNHYQLFD